jgi:hypothetical protein
MEPECYCHLLDIGAEPIFNKTEYELKTVTKTIRAIFHINENETDYVNFRELLKGRFEDYQLLQLSFYEYNNNSLVELCNDNDVAQFLKARRPLTIYIKQERQIQQPVEELLINVPQKQTIRSILSQIFNSYYPFKIKNE